jgi:hypothetical protein
VPNIDVLLSSYSGLQALKLDLKRKHTFARFPVKEVALAVYMDTAPHCAIHMRLHKPVYPRGCPDLTRVRTPCADFATKAYQAIPAGPNYSQLVFLLPFTTIQLWHWLAHGGRLGEEHRISKWVRAKTYHAQYQGS